MIRFCLERLLRVEDAVNICTQVFIQDVSSDRGPGWVDFVESSTKTLGSSFLE